MRQNVGAADRWIRTLVGLGVIGLVFVGPRTQWGWLGAVFGVHDPGPVLNFAPILLMGVLFGLAMDYQLFLVSGMRESYAHGSPARLAVAAGLRGGGTGVTAAAGRAPSSRQSAARAQSAPPNGRFKAHSFAGASGNSGLRKACPGAAARRWLRR